MMIHVKRILLQWYVIKLLYNGASPRSGWKKNLPGYPKWFQAQKCPVAARSASVSPPPGTRLSPPPTDAGWA